MTQLECVCALALIAVMPPTAAKGSVAMTEDHLETIGVLIRKKLDLEENQAIQIEETTSRAPYSIDGLPLRFFEGAWQLDRDPYPVEYFVLLGSEDLRFGGQLPRILAEQRVAAASPEEAVRIALLIIFAENPRQIVRDEGPQLDLPQDELDLLRTPFARPFAGGHQATVHAFVPPGPKTSAERGGVVRHDVWVDPSGCYHISRRLTGVMTSTDRTRFVVIHRKEEGRGGVAVTELGSMEATDAEVALKTLAPQSAREWPSSQSGRTFASVYNPASGRSGLKDTYEARLAEIDEEAAIEAAVEHLGSKLTGIADHMPFSSELKRGVWRVRSSRKSGWFGRRVGADVRQEDGAILRAYFP